MLSQQKEARLFYKARMESQNSKVDHYEQIGGVEAVDITNRHGDTPILDVPHSRRQVTLKDADFGALVDKMDQVRMLIEPTSSYAIRAVESLNHKKDDIFIAAALGIAMTGEDGDIPISLPDTQKVVCVKEDLSGAAANFNVFLLTKIQEKFDFADVDEEGRYLAWTSSQKASMLNETKATSQDYASVKALTSGQINEFMGFSFVRSERLPFVLDPTALKWDNDGTVNLATGANAGLAPEVFRSCFAWCGSGMLSSIGEEQFARISEREDKRYSTQIYVRHSVGCVRMEEVKVVEAYCKQK
jgi:hypothetical protein